MRALLIVSLAVSMAGCGQKAAPGKPGKDGKSPPAELGKAEFTLSSRAFVEDFKKDSKAAHAKYKGKTIELTGLVTSVGVSGSGDPLVMLESEPMKYKWANCFTTERYPAKLLAPGQTATIKGRTHATYADAILIDCEVVKTDGPKPVAMTADEFSDEVGKDLAAAMKKHEKKWLIVSGEAKDVKFNESKAATVVLKTKGMGPPVVFKFTSNDKAFTEKLKPGQKIEMLGQFTSLTVSKKEAGLSDCTLVAEPK